MDAVYDTGSRHFSTVKKITLSINGINQGTVGVTQQQNPRCLGNDYSIINFKTNNVKFKKLKLKARYLEVTYAFK